MIPYRAGTSFDQSANRQRPPGRDNRAVGAQAIAALRQWRPAPAQKLRYPGCLTDPK